MENPILSSGKILVCQRGSRHRYAVPRMLNEEGMLASLYTDSSSLSPAGRLAAGLDKRGISFRLSRALASRIPQGISPERVFSSDALLFPSWMCAGKSRDLGNTYIKWGLHGAGIVYSMYGEEPSFLQWAKKQGATIVVDVFTHPLTSRIVEEEASRCFPGRTIDTQWIHAVEAHSIRAFELADVLLCPSAWVAEGVRELVPDCEGKIRIIPYGSSLKIRAEINMHPRPGRIFFAGRDPLRKGLHYLAKAAHLLHRDGLHTDVRVAGISRSDAGWIEHGEELNFLGDLPLNGIASEFEKADLFVLPSLAEGQVGVVLEALSFGCPVIVTKECGVDLTLDCGELVPARDATALAESIRRVVGNRELRTKLAEGALEQAKMYTTEAWKERLTSVLAALNNDAICL